MVVRIGDRKTGRQEEMLIDKDINLSIAIDNRNILFTERFKSNFVAI